MIIFYLSLLVEPNKLLVRSLKSEKENSQIAKKDQLKKHIAKTRKTYADQNRQNANQTKLKSQSTTTTQPKPKTPQTSNRNSLESCPSKEAISFIKEEPRLKMKTVKKVWTKTKNPATRKDDLSTLDKYINYLKQLLKAKYQHKWSDMPSLCQCNDVNTCIWELDWNTCANNCEFYNNPKGKIKSLNSTLLIRNLLDLLNFVTFFSNLKSMQES